ncbi:50S ribosomal protein L22 [Candidatus Uhrbacteria bacterium]|nr:50S ribosomal protein L22 [Candidatus Uhrbacteria bacterium]
MEIRAFARSIHISPQKVRLVIDVIRGKKVKEAQAQLQFMKKAAAIPVLKLLNSAIANAKNNFKLDDSALYVKTITADEGQTLHRWMSKAMGRATPVRKRTTHVSIVLDEKIN